MTHHLIEIGEWFFVLYLLGINLGYLTLNFLSLFSLSKLMRSRLTEDTPQMYSGLELPISLLIPAYNERSSIITTIHSVLQLNYPEFEIVVINDGSTDDTFNVLEREFSLVPFPEAYRQQLDTKPVRAVYRSTVHSNLRVIDKENGGKADSLNAGINVSRYPLFCSVDADSILDRSSLQKVAQPFLEDALVVATGGTIRIANGCKINNGFIDVVDLPKKLLPLLQVVEYVRAFLFGRLGWSPLNAMLIISGAFGLFKKEVVVEVGGFLSDTIGEDMELVVRIHKHYRLARKKYRIVFVPDPICWTEAPEDLATLKNQRIRWQHGLLESLSANLELLFHYRGGLVGWLAFPFMLFFEALGPIVEILGYLFVFGLALTGNISFQTMWVFYFATICLGILLSVSALMLEEMSFHVYTRPRHLVMLLFAVLIENFGYRQINSWWRIIGVARWVFGREAKWGHMKRSGAWHKPHMPNLT
ncbi:MAG: glycosyltransferase [Gallionellaceae bacterium]|jgi:cellulose synthase/poly-beta-1,6-N-acetylglucosamine synthase-like glycosyltransferase